MLRFNNYIIVFNLLLLLAACTNAKKQQNRILSPIAFTIDTLNFTQYELNKNYSFFYSHYKQQNQTPPNQSAIKRWLDQYIDESYLLADAYRLHYDTAKAIEAQTESMAHLMIAQPMGLLHKNIVQQDHPDEILSEVALRKRVILEQNAYKTWVSKALKTSGLSVNKSTVDQFLIIIKKQGQNGVLHCYDKSISNAVILTYTHYEKREVTVGQLCKFYNNLPIRKPLNTAQDVHFYLESIVLDEFAFEEAAKRGITQSAQFILDKRNFKNALIAAKYRKNALKTDSTISGAEYDEFYRKHANEFSEPEFIVATVYVFPDKNAASEGYFNLQSRKGNPPKGLHKKNFKFKLEDSDRTLMNVLVKLGKDETSMPIQYNNGFIIATLHSSYGKRIPALYDLIPQISPRIKSEKLQKAISRKADSLKKIMKANGLQNLYSLLDTQAVFLKVNSIDKPNIQ